MKSGPPNEKSHYTYDEIIERLEVVKAGKDLHSGKRQKRRSYQPKKEREKRLRLLKIACYGIFIPLVVIGILFAFLANSYYQGTAFKEQVAGKVSEEIGFEVDADNVGVADFGSRVFSNRLYFTGDSDSYFREAEFSSTSANLEKSLWFESDWQVNELVVKSLSLLFASTKIPIGEEDSGFIPPSPPEPEKAGDKSENAPGSAGEKKDVPDIPVVPEVDDIPEAGDGARAVPPRLSPQTLKAAFGLAGGPQSFSLRDLSINRLNLRWTNALREKGAIQNAALYSRIEKRGVRSGELKNGSLKLHHWPDMDIDSIEFEVHGPVVKLTGGRLSNAIFPDSQIRINEGEIDFSKKGGKARVSYSAVRFDISTMMPEKAESFFEGNITCREVTFFGQFDDPKVSVFKGDFEVRRPIVKNLPFQIALQAFTLQPKLLRLELDSLRGRFTKTPEYIELSELEGYQEGVARFSGTLRIEQNGRMSGDLRFGLSREVIRNIPENKIVKFEQQDDQFGWLPIKFGGKVKEPNDTLGAYIDAMQRGGALNE